MPTREHFKPRQGSLRQKEGTLSSKQGPLRPKKGPPRLITVFQVESKPIGAFVGRKRAFVGLKGPFSDQ